MISGSRRNSFSHEQRATPAGPEAEMAGITPVVRQLFPDAHIVKPLPDDFRLGNNTFDNLPGTWYIVNQADDLAAGQQGVFNLTLVQDLFLSQTADQGRQLF